MTAFVLGNGRSRLNIDPKDLNGTVYGCNAIYRDFLPDYLIAVDNKMIVELVQNNVPNQTSVWSNKSTRYPMYDTINYFEPNKGWSSGPSALWLASQHNHKEIYILGFDYDGIDTKFNNVYANTLNYKKSTDNMTYYGNWLNQTESVVKENSHIQYYRVVEKNDDLLAHLIPQITYVEFKKR